MRNYLQISLPIIALILSGQMSAMSDEATDSTNLRSGKRRIALALPIENAPKPNVSSIPAGTSQTADSSAQGSLIQSFSSKSPAYGSKVSGPAEIPDNLLDVMVEGAKRTETFSRTYNRRIADLIGWVACSMQPTTEITPLSSPSLMSKQRNIKLMQKDHQDRLRAILFN